MFYFQETDETNPINFSKAMDLLGSGQQDEARIFISDVIDKADPDKIWFASGLQDYMQYDSEFSPDIIAMFEFHNSKMSKVAVDKFNKKQEEITSKQTTPQIVTPIEMKEGKISIEDKLSLAVAIKDLLSKDRPIDSPSDLLCNMIVTFLNKELKNLFGESSDQNFTQEEVVVLKHVAKRMAGKA